MDACGGFSGRALPIAVAVGQSSEQVRHRKRFADGDGETEAPKNEDFASVKGDYFTKKRILIPPFQPSFSSDLFFVFFKGVFAMAYGDLPVSSHPPYSVNGGGWRP